MAPRASSFLIFVPKIDALGTVARAIKAGEAGLVIAVILERV